jgi:hypothetical protein
MHELFVCLFYILNKWIGVSMLCSDVIPPLSHTCFLAAGVDLNRVVRLAPKHVGKSCEGIG